MLRDGNRYGNFESTPYREALSFYHQIFAESLAPRMTNTQISNVWNELGKGFYSFYISGPWNIREFKRRMPPELKDSWMTAPMPGPTGPGVSNAGGASVVIFKRSRHQDASWALVEFLSRPDTQRRFYELTGDLPPRRTSWESGEIATDPYTRAFRVQLERLRTFPQVPEWEQIMQAMRVMAERVVQDQESIDHATMAFDVEVNDMLAKRRWLIDKRAPRAPAGT
jgi:multiple sugar transport system substrate-binding protein